MSDLLRMDSKVPLGCDRCDTCCKYRGDIRITAKNIYNISKFLNISPEEFIGDYTYELENEFPERALKGVGDDRHCICYDTESKLCGINPVKPLQCVVFPLVPENVKNDVFYVKGKCNCQHKNLITVDEWLNGNNNIYNKNKDINYRWVKVIEYVQYYSDKLSVDEKMEIRRLLFFKYNYDSKFIDFQIKRNIRKIYKLIERIYNLKKRK